MANKYYGRKTFEVTPELTITCETQNTRSGFCHVASLFHNGNEIEFAKACYQNRTWEAWEYQSVIHGLINKTKKLTKEQKEAILGYLDGKDGYTGEGNKRAMAGLKMVGAIMAMGDLMAKTQEDKNDWKQRMLKAGLEGRGLIMPDDWDSLTEDQKTERLNGVQEILK